MFRKLTIIKTIIVVCLLTAGCGPNRIVQCNQLIATINKGHSLVNTETSYDAATTNKLGGQLEEIAQELEALELKDKNLQQFQNNFSQTFKELSQAFIDMSLGLKSTTQVEASLEGRKKFNQARTQIIQAGQQVNKVAVNGDISVEKLVSYCQDN